MQATSLRVRGTKSWFAAAAKFFPSMSASKIGVLGASVTRTVVNVCCRSATRCHAQLAPDGVLSDQNLCARMLEQLPLLIRREFVIERNQNAAGVKNRIGGDKPLGLIRHDDAGAIAGGEAPVLQRPGERVRARLGSRDK